MRLTEPAAAPRRASASVASVPVSSITVASFARPQILMALAPKIRAAVGPCIGRASYEVAADLRDPMLAHDPRDERFFLDGARPERWQFDLGGYCAGRLAAVGVTRVDLLDADTCADEARFFSHRRRTLARSGPIGHQISAIVL